LWLVNALLDIPRLESEHMLLDLTDILAADVLAAGLAQVQLLIAQRNVQVVVEGDTAVTVYADSELLHRLLVNLLSNALKYTPDDSTICIMVSPQKAERLVCFSVADQGPGVPPEWLEKVFDMFVQVDARKTGKSMGSGVGLAFCRLAVEAQGGRIWMENQPTGGAKVSFTLPTRSWSHGTGLVGSEENRLQKVV
jgi:signal transduction histidine kinase